MNFVELPCRFIAKLSKDQLDEIEALVQTQVVVSSGDFDEESYRNELLDEYKAYEYGNMVVDLSEIFSFNAVDDDHTYVRFMNNLAMTFKVPYYDFMAIVVDTTKNVIQTLNVEEEANNGTEEE